MLILLILGALYLVFQSLANAESEFKSIIQTPFNIFGSAVDSVGSELSSIWKYITGQNVTDNAQFDPGAGGSW